MHTPTPVPRHPGETHQNAARALERLSLLRSTLETELATMPAPEPGATEPVDAPGSTVASAHVSALLQRLSDYWQAAGSCGRARFDAVSTAMRQMLEDEVILKIHERELRPEHAACLPGFTGPGKTDVFTLQLALEDDELAPMAGTLVLTHEQGPTLLVLPGLGTTGFASLDEMRHALVRALNTARSLPGLLNTLELRHRERFEAISDDPDLFLDAFTAADLVLTSVHGEPFAHALDSLLAKQREDVRHACATSAVRSGHREQRVRQALEMGELIGPGAMLALREEAFQDRRERQSLPDWVKFADKQELATYIEHLQGYDQVRAAVLSVLGAAASPESFALAHLRLRLSDDLGHDLDPGAISVATRRTLPVTGEVYTVTRSLVELALYGLHPDDLLPGSEFLSQTTISMDDAAFEPVRAMLTTGYIAQLIDELDLRVRFGDYQRSTYEQEHHQSLMAVLAGTQITTLAYAAKMQGHIGADDHTIIEAATRSLDAGATAEPQVQQVRIREQVMGKLLVLRKHDGQGRLERLILVAADAPSGQRLKAFDNETQLSHEVLGWLASDAMRDYLLGQVEHAARQALAAYFSALRLKPYPEGEFLNLVHLPDYKTGLQRFAKAQVTVALSEQARHTPGWYVQASREQRQELVALEDAAAGALAAYQEKPHTRVQPFDEYVHGRASQQIARLLDLPVGKVDPDLIIIYSERETVSYTELLRNGYDDSLGLIRTSADTHAKFSGPTDVDLSLLTPERVAGSVRGKWLADDYVALIKQTLLDNSAPGYEYRRQTSVLITQLQMQAAALRSLLKGHISPQQYQWLRESIDHAHVNDIATRGRYPLYPLQIHVDKPLIGTELSGVDQLVIPDTLLTHIETVQGCIAVLPVHIRQAPLLYTPQAPDGLEFRLFSSFTDSLHSPGMLDYYTNRCRLKSHKTLRLFLADMRQGNASKAPFLPKEAIRDFAEICFERPIRRRLRDVEETTVGRHDMLGQLVWASVEIIASIITLPFPPASFAVGVLLSLHDTVRALQALRDGETEEASAYILTSLLNSLGAAGDFHSGLKGLGGPLSRRAPAHRSAPLAGPLQRHPSLPRYEDLFPVELGQERFLVSKPNQAGHAPVFRGDGAGVRVTGQFAVFSHTGQWQPLAHVPVSLPPAPTTSGIASDLKVNLSLRKVPRITDGHAAGVHIVDGKPHIELAGDVYRVHYNAQLQCWQVVDPANPFAFFGKQPVRLDERGQWQLADRPRLRGGMEEAGRYRPLNEDPPGSSAALGMTSEYELPPHMQKHLHIIMNPEPYDPSGYGLESYFETYFGDMRKTFTTLREKLYRDADAFFSRPVVPARPALPALAPPVSFDTWLERVFVHSKGLIFSETLNSVASKRLLILNMPKLVEQRVEVLYVEHLFTDRHLPKLAQYRALGNKSRAGSHEIKYHFKDLNGGALDNQTTEYDYYHLVKAAHRHGIEVRPFSSSISYPLNAHPVASAAGDNLAGQKMSKFFGHKVISGDAAADPSRRWVALLEHRIATAHDGLPGIADLEGVISAHVDDIPAGRPTRVTAGAAANPGVQSDYVIGYANPLILPPASVLPPSSQVDDALFKALADPESLAAGEGWAGNYGFRWDDVGGWQHIEPHEWAANNPPTAIQQSLTDSAFDTPLADRSLMHTLANFQSKGLDQQYFILDPEMGRVRSAFFTRRRMLQGEAASVLTQELPPRPALPVVEPHTSLPDFLNTLYEHTDAVVIGESHSSIASKKLIIDNLPLLAKQNVRTLYMEHLLTDLHQADLDRFFETGYMNKRLLHDVQKLDRGHLTDPERLYNFERLLVKAQQQGIEVRAIDCVASYHLKGLLDKADTSRQQIMNYFAARTIRKHQEVVGAHKWIALVGNSHASTFASVVPGIAELHGGISLRIIDVLPGKSSGITPDPGELLPVGMTRQTAAVRSDFRVEIEVNRLTAPIRPPQPLPVEDRLALPGMFLIEQEDGGAQAIVHRSRTLQIHRTPVQIDEQGRLYVERPSWTAVNLTRYEDMDALIAALKGMNLTRVG